MINSINQNTEFINLDWTAKRLDYIVFEECSFENCKISESNFYSCKFIDCRFKNSDLSNSKLPDCLLNNIRFENCKVLGINFSDCCDSPFSVSFSHCNLDYCSISGKKLIKTSIDSCSARSADFSDADLTKAEFINTDLLNSIFNNTILKGADMRSAFNYIIDPEYNNIRKAKFSLSGIPGLLSKYEIEIE